MRPRSEGTPRNRRSTGYQYPDRRAQLVIFSSVAALVLFIGALLLYVAGARQTLSPGNVASHHARIDLKCAQCHTTGHGVEPLRCERCHDSAGTDRLTNAAHVLDGSADRHLADQAAALNCATCHTEHLGRAHQLSLVDDRECATCHTFRSFAKHPEFSVLSKPGPNPMKFTHERHVALAEKEKGASCQTCHEQTTDHKGFQPINFDRHCSSCHIKDGLLNGESSPIDLTFVLAPGDPRLPKALQSKVAMGDAARGRKVARNLVHKDPWMVFNLAWLRRSIDFDGDEVERVSLRSRITYLEQLQALPAGSPGPAPAGDATGELVAAANDLFTALSRDSAPDAAPVAASAPLEFEARRRELLSLLDAIQLRLGASATEQVNALRTRALALQPGGSTDAGKGPQQKQRDVDRLQIAHQIDASPMDRDDTPTQQTDLDRAELARMLTASRTRLAELESTSAATALAADRRAAGIKNLADLTSGVCQKCHEIDANGSRFVPLHLAEPVMRRSRFNHAPHTVESRCESCHTGIRASKQGSDVNIPGVAVCQTCHRASQVKATCDTCHAYHPKSSVDFVAGTR